MNSFAYRGFTIFSAFEGWRVKEPDGAQWPEKYPTVTAARESIDRELRGRK